MENIALNAENVASIKKKIEDNTALQKDYEDLDFLLSAINMGGFILNLMKEKGYLNYQHFINQRGEKSPFKKDNASESFIFGAMMEAISLLSKKL